MKGLSELGIETILLDVTKIDTIRAAKEIVSKENNGKLHILVNNAWVLGGPGFWRISSIRE